MATKSPESKHIFTITPEQRDALLAPQHDLKQLEPMFQSLRDTYEEEGFVLVRGLLDERLQQRICSAGQALTDGPTIGKLFSSLQFGPVFNEQEAAFREASLNSAIPALIARVLFGLDDKQIDNKEAPPSLRLLKDAFMAKGKEESHCGWHVDDNVFWPTDSKSSGVNLWLALDDMRAKYGGGLAISPRSHTAEWRRKAYETIGSTPTLPPEGVTPAKLMKTFGKTCEMATLNREVNDQIESSKLVLDYQPGDCLFCHRWLFHRSVPINQEGLKHYNDGSTLKRYTIRYERGTARLMQGISLEPCILMNPDNSGKSLDEVCKHDGPFYPQCWPPLEEDASRAQESGLEILAREILPAAQTKKSQMVKDLMAMAKKDAPSYS